MALGRRQILGSHLIFTGYGHWAANDPRGSGSESIRKEEFKSLGEILPGRQYPRASFENFTEKRMKFWSMNEHGLMSEREM